MKSKFTWILTLLLLLCVQVGFAQQKQISGVVKTEYGDPLEGAAVLLVGTDKGTVSDADGNYTLSAKKGDRIRVEILGFFKTTLTVSDSNVLNFTLKEEESTDLEGIVITQYRTTTKEENANAVSTVTSKTIEGRPNASFIQTLQGQVPGLNISTGSGQPGDNNTTVILRGVGSINGNIEPLYVIDGVPMSSDRFRSLNPNDIESITVLKDAGATAIYGNRGANGVIDIKTKNASFDSSLQVKYVGTTGVSTIQNNNYNLMNAQQYVDFVDRAKTDYPSAGFSKFTNSQKRNLVNTDWVDVFFNDAISQTHTLSLAAGSKNLSSYTSIGYAEYEGILKGTGLKRFNFRSNMNGKGLGDRLNFGTNVSANYSKSEMVSGTGSNGVNQNFFLGAFQSLPYLNPNEYTDTWQSASALFGKYGMSSMPYLLLDKRRTEGYSQNEFKMLVNGNVNYKLSNTITASNQTGVDYQSINQNRWTRYDAFNERYFAVAGQDYFGYVSEIVEDRMIFNSNTNIRYEETFNNLHKISAGAYLEYIKAHYKSRSIAKTGFDPNFWSDGGSTGWIGSSEDFNLYAPSGGISIQNAGLFSYFGNASYDYDRRYGIDATIRRDASFRFTADNRWGTFWSVSGRWNINNEAFLKNSTVVNNLKLRGSYGTAGNQDINGTGIFGAAQLYNTLYSTGIGYDESSVYVLSNLPNSSLQWEVVTQANIGLDFGFWQDRLRGSLDVYRKQTDDLFQARWVSAINGTSTLPANFGSLKNEGVELNIAGDVIRNNTTRLTLTGNGSYNKNTVLDIPSFDGTIWNGGLTGLKEGGMIGQYYMHEFAGINPQNGNMLFYTADGELTEDPKDSDRRWLGKSSIPVYQGGFGLDFEHKGWFLTANFTYAIDAWRYDNDYYFFTSPTFVKQNNLSMDMHDYWTPENTDASFPKLAGSNFAYASGTSFYLQDASYVRLRYLSLGYNFQKQALDFMKLAALRVYVQGENLHTWSKWRGWDAESNRSVDFSQYPTPKTFSFGVEVSF